MQLTKKKVIIGAILVFLLLFGLFSAGKLYEDVDAGEIVVIQDPVDGDLHVIKEPGLTWQGWGKATHYKKSNQFRFEIEMDGKEITADRSIPVKWNDGGTATIAGSVRWDMPSNDDQIRDVHSRFGSQEAIEKDLIKTNIEKAVTMTGPLMSSKESYAEKKNDLIYYIEDQASKGAYKNRQINVKEIDPITETEKTVMKVEVMTDSNHIPLRQEVSPIVAVGVKLYNISIKDIHYDKRVEDQIAAQQQATMQVQTAIANAKKAEQEALTTAKQGEADAIKAKWEQEVIKAKMVTEAEARKAQAELDVKTAELNKQKLILEGEGEAAKKRLAMQADGALQQKLAAWLESQKYWSEAFSKYSGSMVPQVVTGGNGSNSNALNFMEIMGVKAAKDLALDLSNKGN